MNFFINHGLFKLRNRPQWYTVTGRSRTYVKKVLNEISGEIFKNYKVISVNRNENNVRIKIGEDYLDYDHIVLASHADQSLKMLDKPTEEEQRILSKFKYVSNQAILHSDEKLMPKKKLAWSSWNSISNGKQTSVTYWLNNLQNLKSIDWDTGCYVGQEITARMKYRALLKKKIYSLEIISGEINVGDNIILGKISIGKVISKG